MTITPPVVAPISLGGLTPIYRQPSEIVPFTQRSGATFMEEAATLHRWVLGTLIPFLNTEFDGVETAWEAQITELLSSLDTFFAEESASNAAAIAQALAAIAAHEATVTDPLIIAVLNNASSATHQYLDARYVNEVDYGPRVAAFDASFNQVGARLETHDGLLAYVQRFDAPAPTGNDDTAALMAVITAAAQNRGVVYLAEGTYRCNLDLPAGFSQIMIVGRGRRYTTLRAFVLTKPVVKFNGGSGSLAGGGLFSLSVNGADHTVGSTVGIAFSGCGGVRVEDVNVSECAVGVLWWNERSGDFTEFDTFSGAIDTCAQPFVYRDDNNVESFHGSGPLDAVVQMIGSLGGPVIGTVGNALPYNAPLGVKVFFNNGAQFLMNYVNTAQGRPASFIGNITIEGQINNDSQLVRGNNNVLFQGAFSYFASGTATLGNLFLCSKVSYQGGTVLGEFLPVTQRYALSNSPTNRFAGILRNGESGMISVHIIAANYDFSQILFVYQSPYNSTGPTPIVMATMSNIDNRSAGIPQYSWNAGLYISNPNYTADFSANAKLTVLGGALGNSDLAQFS